MSGPSRNEMPERGGSEGSLAAEASAIIEASRRGVLCTLLPEGGEPYGSLVDILPLPGGDAIMLLSRLAEHRTNLDADPRASLLLGPAVGAPDALTRPRVTIVGRTERVEDPATCREAYIQAHPTAATYVDFADFAFYRLHAGRLRYIAGFGRMGWLSPDDV